MTDDLKSEDLTAQPPEQHPYVAHEQRVQAPRPTQPSLPPVPDPADAPYRAAMYAPGDAELAARQQEPLPPAEGERVVPVMHAPGDAELELARAERRDAPLPPAAEPPVSMPMYAPGDSEVTGQDKPPALDARQQENIEAAERAATEQRERLEREAHERERLRMSDAAVQLTAGEPSAARSDEQLEHADTSPLPPSAARSDEQLEHADASPPPPPSAARSDEPAPAEPAPAKHGKSAHPGRRKHDG